MKTRFPGKSARILALTLLVIAALLLLLLLGELFLRYRWADETLSHIEPRYARLEKLASSGEGIRSQYDQLAARLQQLAKPATANGEQVSTELQQIVRSVGESHGIIFSGTQILPVIQQEGFRVVSVRAAMNGELPQFLKMLSQLRQSQPPIIAGDVTLSAPRQGGEKPNRQMTVQASLNLLIMEP